MFEVGKKYYDKAGEEYTCVSVDFEDDDGQSVMMMDGRGWQDVWSPDGCYWPNKMKSDCDIDFSRTASSLPDSGDRTNFDTGAVRDAMNGKGLPSLIPPEAIRRCARRFEDGASKYGLHNWMKGIPLSRYQDAITRHTLAAAEGQTDEDHLGAVLWNAAAWVWTQDEIEAGRLPASLDDRPYIRKAVSDVEE